MNLTETVGAIVLCGGQSSRMQRDKAWLPIGDETFLQSICRIVDGVATTTVVVAAADQLLPALPEIVVIARDPVADQGPLFGLLTGLQTLQRTSPGVEIAWVGSCDAPFVNTAVIRQLLRSVPGRLAVAVTNERGLQPLGAVYRMTCLPIVEQLFANGERRLLALLDRLNIRVIEADAFREHDPELRFLQNVNSPEDYERFVK